MRDGIIVLDAQNRLADLNPAAECILGRRVAGMLGQAVERLLADQPDLVAGCRGVTEACMESALSEDLEGARMWVESAERLGSTFYFMPPHERANVIELTELALVKT